MWNVARVAALGLPGTVHPVAVRDYLGGGCPLIQLARIDFDVDADGSGAAVGKVFPGARARRISDLVAYTIALEHPWLGEAMLSWANEKDAWLKTVFLRPVLPTNLEHREELAQCVARGLEIEADVHEPYSPSKEGGYTFAPKEGGEIRIDHHRVEIDLRDTPFAPAMPKATWEKALLVLDACGRT